MSPRRAGLLVLHNPRAAISLLYLVVIFLAAATAPLIAPYSPIEQNVRDALAPPSLAHILGTDDLGRDVLSRLIHGALPSLYGSSLAVAIALVVGVPAGLCAGFLGGWVDIVIGRVIDTLLSFPGVVLAIGVTGALGLGLTNGMISVGIAFSPVVARIMRAQTLAIRTAVYIDAARCFGSGPLRLLVRHVLPNSVQPVIVQAALLLAVGLLAEASLSFLGLGVQPPQPSWGAMLARAYNYMDIAPEQVYTPGFAILLTALAFNALGNALRQALDPTTRSVS